MRASGARTWLPLVAIILLFLGLGVIYNLTVPIWEAPDETGHFGNVWYIATHGALPTPGTFYTWHQSPLYHILAAAVVSWVDMPDLLTWTRYNPDASTVSARGEVNVALHTVREWPPYRDVPLGVHLARGVTLLFGVLTAGLSYLLARRLFPGQLWVAIGAAGLVAFNPQFIFMSAAVQNDVPLAAAFALTLLPASVILQGDVRRRQFLALGALVGLAILFKQSGAVLVGLAGGVVAWAAWRARSWRHLLVWTAVILLGLMTVAGPMYARNMLRYGDPFAYKVYESLHPATLGVTLGDINLRSLLAFANTMHRTFWGTFGWANLPMPQPVYLALWLIYPLGWWGVGRYLRRTRAAQVRGGWPVIGLLLGGMASVWAFTLQYVLGFGAFGVQGRYLFQMISAHALLISLGLCSLLPGRAQPVPLILVLVGLLGLAAWAPTGLIAPSYEYLGDTPEIIEDLPYRRTEVFGDTFELIGYRAKADLESGRLQVTLYWQALTTPDADYTMFVHLLNGHGQRLSQHDRQPLDGDFPTSLWRVGDVMHTTHNLQASADCLKSPPCYLAVGVYDWQTGQRLPVTRGQSEHDAVLLTEFGADLGLPKR